MKRIRIFALVLCVVMVFVIFSGCNKKDKLSAKKEQEIKEAYVTFYNETHPNHNDIDVNSVDIYRYYGTYNDAVVILIYPCDDSDEQAQGTIVIAGIEIITGPSGYPPLFVYKNGEFTEIEEAYENGILTEQDIAYIARRSKNPN